MCQYKSSGMYASFQLKMFCPLYLLRSKIFRENKYRLMAFLPCTGIKEIKCPCPSVDTICVFKACINHQLDLGEMRW